MHSASGRRKYRGTFDLADPASEADLDPQAAGLREQRGIDRAAARSALDGVEEGRFAVKFVTMAPGVESNTVAAGRPLELAGEAVFAKFVKDVVLGRPVFQPLMIALKAGAHLRRGFVDHDAASRARQRDGCGKTRGARPDNLYGFAVG